MPATSALKTSLYLPPVSLTPITPLYYYNHLRIIYTHKA